MYISISSYQNKIYKHIKALGNKKYRDKSKQFIIEGVRIVKDAIFSSVKFDFILLSEAFIEKEENADIIELINTCSLKMDCKIYLLSDKLFNDISYTETPQGIMAVVSMPQFSIEDISVSNSFVFIFCEEVTEPGNMGTIIRTADAAGVNAVILSKGCVDVYNPKVVRAAMGSLFHLPIVNCEKNANETLNYFKLKGARVISGDLSAKKNHFDVNMRDKIVIVTGNEANGISSEVQSISDELVKIPILGSAESLNAGVATGILIYEAVRQRI